MDASGNALWTVIIVAEQDRGLGKMYEMSQTTSLEEVMKMWMEEFHLIGNWRFMSPDRKIEYEEWMSLEMVGETSRNSSMVNLKVKLSETRTPRPVCEVFVQDRDQCHLLHVEPTQTLYEVLSSLPGRSSAYQWNDEQLNLSDTVEEAGLENNALIHEPRRLINVNVKLSDGNIVIIRVPEGSLVLHLYEEIQRYEMDDFSLEYEGRHLKRDERVKPLKQVIEVTCAVFVVNIRGQRIRWISKSSAIGFPEFISQLSMKANLNEAELERMEYRCVGCQRCISKSEGEIQILPIKCCREKSLTLTATLPLEKKSNSATQTMIECVQSCYVQLCQRKREDGTRELCRKLNEEISTMEMKYNTILSNIEQVTKTIQGLDKEVEEEVKDEESIDNKYHASLQEVKNKGDPAFDLTWEMKMVKNRKIDSKTDDEDLQWGASAGRPHPFEMPIESPGVELLVMYGRKLFSVAVSRPEVQSQGMTPDPALKFLKCVVPGLRPGWATFDDVRNALQPLLVAGQIRGIEQWRGNLDKRTVVVTAPDDDEKGGWRFASIEGRQYSWEEVEKKFTAIIAPGDNEMEEYLKKISWIDIDKGGEVLIVGERLRTVLEIIAHPSAD